MNTRFPIRGGSWNNGSNAGLGALNVNNARSNANSNIGFRPALYDDVPARSKTLTRACPCNFKKDAVSLPQGRKLRSRSLDASCDCLFMQVVQFDNLHAAAYQCRQGRAKKPATVKFFGRLEEHLITIQNELIWGLYSPMPYSQFCVYEPKIRQISAPNFRDRVVHRAIYNVIEPLFDLRFIDDSYACRKGKGTHAGADRAQSYLRSVYGQYGKAYVLKADIKHYFASIDHDVLKELVRAKIGCERMVELLCFIIDTSPTPTVGVGIPLGSLTSQLFANIYLHELDLFVKHGLRAKKYMRYMDDFILVHNDKALLHEWRAQIEGFLWRELRLKTNGKTQVFPVSKRCGRSLDFLGYRIYVDHRLLRKSSVKTIKRKLKKMHADYARGRIEIRQAQRVLASWLGHASHANANRLTRKLLSRPFIKGGSNV